MNKREKILLQLSKTKRYDFALVDEVAQMLSEIDVQSKLDSVYSKYAEAKEFGEEILNDLEIERDSIADKVTELENVLNELGVESDIAEKYSDDIYTIDREREGLMQYLDQK
tara:strand:- start:787 stop:1122 length:336 start_codon:yes stop_codon:yes gene_type:complete